MLLRRDDFISIASLDFVELNKTVWITVFEVKSPKSP